MRTGAFESFILASGSPRRRELLGQLGLRFEVLPADLDESIVPGERPAAYVERLARQKAAAVHEQHPSSLVLAADTSVVVDDEILGKPGADVALGEQMLRRLSNRTHQVMTGVAVAGATVESLVVTSEVVFRALFTDEIRWYVAKGEGRDKAGGYALQGIGAAFISELRGSPTSVIGLPLPESLELLRRGGLSMPWEPA